MGEAYNWVVSICLKSRMLGRHPGQLLIWAPTTTVTYWSKSHFSFTRNICFNIALTPGPHNGRNCTNLHVSWLIHGSSIAPLLKSRRQKDVKINLLKCDKYFPAWEKKSRFTRHSALKLSIFCAYGQFQIGEVFMGKHVRTQNCETIGVVRHRLVTTKSNSILIRVIFQNFSSITTNNPERRIQN